MVKIEILKVSEGTEQYVKYIGAFGEKRIDYKFLTNGGLLFRVICESLGEARAYRKEWYKANVKGDKLEQLIESGIAASGEIGCSIMSVRR